MIKQTILMGFLLFGRALPAAKVQNAAPGTVSLKSLIESVEKKFGHSFMFSNTDVDINRPMAYDAENLETLLQGAFGSGDIGYAISGKRILLTRKTPPAQRGEVSGRVSDEQGRPLPGVNIHAKGSNRHTVTDNFGNFTVEIRASDVLEVRYLGFAPQDVPVVADRPVAITLLPGREELEEVVVIGYGTLRKSDVTGAITTIDTDDLAKRATTSPAEALQGSAAGVNVQKNSGLAGDGVQIKIRGVNTFGSNEPLYVIDGFPGSIDNISPNDIASMEVLKDGAAAAIYGSVAANGVVIVTTKAGKAGKVLVDINSFANATSTAKRLDVLDADGYVAVHRRMYEEYNKYATTPVALPDYRAPLKTLFFRS